MGTKHLIRVKFTELYEVEGAFGREWIAPAGGGFPKHLVYSYDLKAKTVVFPIGWMLTERGGTNEDNWTRTEWEFYFGDFCRTVLRREYVKKVDWVEVKYNPEEFQPDKELGLLTLRVPRRNKARTDKLIKKYLTTKMIVAERSKESSKVIRVGRKERWFPQYLYELIIQKSKWRGFVNELYGQNLVPKTERFAIWMVDSVFPRELAYFKKTD